MSLRLVSYGEAMLRFEPASGREEWRGQPSATSPYIRSVGGDELNVCVALARLGRNTSWASVLPTGALGDVVSGCAEEAGVRLDSVVREGAEVGTFFVLPEEARVHYQRQHSAFCTQRAGLFDWQAILAERSSEGGRAWLHMTGITPMLGQQAASCWTAAIRAASAARVPVSLDLNYRPQLGSFDQLWSIVGPELQHIDVLILSVNSSELLADHLGLSSASEPEAKRQRGAAGLGAAAGEDDSEVLQLLRAIRGKLQGPAVTCCFKQRGSDKQQKRWSAWVDGTGTHTTEATPTIHVPKDECGGGSAWAAGLIDALSRCSEAASEALKPTRDGALVALGGHRATLALRSGDILAALAQESVGDMSTATQADFDMVEQKFRGRTAIIGVLPSDFGSARLPAVVASAASDRVSFALQRMDSAKVIAILRAKHEDLTVKRAVELADLGYRAIEVTADSVGFAEGRLLPAVVRAIGDRCLVGIGTVTTVEQLELAARGGAHFALSPVRPSVGWGSEGFVWECHKRGVLAMPAAFTPQEIYECVEQHGAHTVKIFPAQLWSPSTLQDLRRIGDFGKYRLCPSGGIDCSTAEAWLKAGATAVGMGSCLVGKDVATSPSDAEALAAAEENWRSKAKPDATALAKRLGLVAPDQK
ncbi:unnamed protein product [Polarella glacialis]|uniref:Carbohydrate kinase PfkB domain-containing protein n=1 Tax=Polarella glacialis TaxID=89957 RepID=A0A813KNJ7_POLGL|nr:unnamed protein product [Polarella glacialis]